MSWKQIPREAIQKVKEEYEKLNFCFEIRLHLADFIETHFIHNNVNDALSLTTQLFSHLAAYIKAHENSPAMFTSIGVLQSSYKTLKVCQYDNLRYISNCICTYIITYLLLKLKSSCIQYVLSYTVFP